MTDRERLEAIVAVVCQYLPPDGISREKAMSQIISLVDPLPEKGWIGMSDVEVEIYSSGFSGTRLVREIVGLLKERNT
jgi:hypothetical protein